MFQGQFLKRVLRFPSRNQHIYIKWGKRPFDSDIDSFDLLWTQLMVCGGCWSVGGCLFFFSHSNSSRLLEVSPKSQDIFHEFSPKMFKLSGKISKETESPFWKGSFFFLQCWRELEILTIFHQHWIKFTLDHSFQKISAFKRRVVHSRFTSKIISKHLPSWELNIFPPSHHFWVNDFLCPLVWYVILPFRASTCTRNISQNQHPNISEAIFKPPKTISPSSAFLASRSVLPLPNGRTRIFPIECIA